MVFDSMGGSNVVRAIDRAAWRRDSARLTGDGQPTTDIGPLVGSFVAFCRTTEGSFGAFS